MAEQKKKKIRVVDQTQTPVDDIKVDTKYCISEDLRAQQIYEAIARGLPTISPGKVTSDPIACACFGPSLKSTLEELRQFPKIISMSGSHDVLIENGIIPTLHIECDPRPHKAGFLKHPHKDVTYLISSTCHADVFEAVRGYKTMIWHLYGNEDMPDMPFIYPRGHWVLTGGSNVGLRSMVLSRFLGHTKIHVFGMDCSFESEAGNTHAGFHPNSTKFRMKVNVGGTDYITSAVFLEYAKQFFHEVAKLPDCEIVLHGDGLLQSMALEKKNDPTSLPSLPANTEAIIAMSAKETISKEYLQLNKQLHKDRPDYGTSGAKRVDAVTQLRTQLKLDTVLDYGCGKGMLAKNLPFPIWEYDPAVVGKDDVPRPADLVICSDVLEHIEPELLQAVIGDLRRVTKRMMYAVINTGPARKTLADGRNAHLIQKPMEWWIEQLSSVFKVQEVPNTPKPEVHLCCEPLAGKQLPILRSVGSQIKTPESQIADKPQRVTTVGRDGTKVQYLTPNNTTLYRAQTLFTKEPITVEWINTFEPGEIFFDVGANVGTYTIWACKHRGVKAVAIEPEHSNFDLLTHNINLNKCDATAARMALTDTPAQGLLYLSGTEPGGSCHSFNEAVDYKLEPRDGETQDCAGAPLDLLIKQHEFPKPNHIKIDVDGFEFKVINGMLETLASPELKSLLIEVNTNLPQHQDMLNQLLTLGWHYDQKQVNAALRKDGAFKGCGEFLFTRDTLFVPVALPNPGSKLEQYIVNKINEAPLHKKPYPFLYLQQALPPDFYDELLNWMPPFEEYRTLAEARGTNGYPQRYVCAPLGAPWEELEEAMRSGKVREAMCNKFGVQGPKDEVLLIRDLPGYKIGPHTDTPAKVISALFYLPKDDKLKKHGTSIYVPKEEGFTNAEGKHFSFDLFKRYATMKYEPNTAFIFAKTDNAFHGVEPFDGDGARDVYLYDIRK